MAEAPVDARFELLERVDDVGRGEAWRGRDLQVRNRAVIVKRLDAGAGVDEALRRVRSLRHGAVLPLLHNGTWEGRAYIVYEPFDAPSLSTWLARVWRGDEAPSRATLERIAAKLCEALDAGHAQTPPIAHGALSPESVLVRVTPQGTDVRVVDFGISGGSRGLDDDLSDLGRTLRAIFAAPESRRDGAVAEGLDWRRDDLPDEAWRVALRAMEGRPDDRFADVTSVLEALEAAWRASVRGPAERPTSPVGLPPRIERARRDEAPAPPPSPTPSEAPPSASIDAPPIAVVTETRPRDDDPRLAQEAPPPSASPPDSSAERGAEPRPTRARPDRVRMLAAAALTGALLALLFALALRAALL